MRISNNEFLENAIVAAEELTGSVFMNAATFSRLRATDHMDLVPGDGGMRHVFRGRKVFVDDNLVDGVHADWSEPAKAIHRRFGSVGRMVSASRVGIETEMAIQPARQIEHLTIKPSINGKVITEALARLGGHITGANA